jgi:hypothetical protein
VLIGAICAVVALAALVACQSEPIETNVDIRERTLEGDPRGFMLGFSDIPSDLTDEAYIATYDLVADYGEVLLIQRIPAWSTFMSGPTTSGRIADQAEAERDAARIRNLSLVVALDPFDPTNRARLNMLPDTHAGRDLSDPELRSAFVNEAVFIAREMRPDYLVLGMDVNVAFERNPNGYRLFVETYREAYAAVKEIAPDLPVLVSFQYEELLGIMPDLPPHAPRWELLRDFEGALDLLGITSYPSFVYSQARRVPPDYYLDIARHTDLPVAFLSVGYSSAPGRDGINSSTPDEQRRFLQRLVEDVDRLGSPMLIWFAARDLLFAETPPYDLIASLGLQAGDGEGKQAWPVWETASNRPFDPDLAAEVRRASDPDATPEPDPQDGEDDGETEDEDGEENGPDGELDDESSEDTDGANEDE